MITPPRFHWERKKKKSQEDPSEILSRAEVRVLFTEILLIQRLEPLGHQIAVVIHKTAMPVQFYGAIALIHLKMECFRTVSASRA
jgi:hypothetical protein